MGRGGLEPPTHGFSVRDRNEVNTEEESTYENNSRPSATALAKTLLKFPELQEIIEAWETLPEDTREQIYQIVQGK